MKKKSLSKEDVLQLSKLAGLTLVDDEIVKYKTQLEETISYIENLNELATDNVSPSSSATFLKNVFFDDGEKNKRGLNLEEVFQNTQNKDDNCFKVKKIFDE